MNGLRQGEATIVELTTDWFTNQIRDLRKVVAPYVGRPGLRMLEIGAYEGRSTIWFLNNVLVGPGCHLTTIDPFMNYFLVERASNLPAIDPGEAIDEPALKEMEAVYHRFRQNTSEYVFDGRLTVFVGRSQPFLAAGVAGRVHTRPGDGYDLIYVDGSHTAPDVLSDAVLAWTLLNSGGTIIFDDYLWDDVPGEENRPRIAIDGFLACFKNQLEEIHRGYQVAVRKR